MPFHLSIGLLVHLVHKQWLIANIEPILLIHLDTIDHVLRDDLLIIVGYASRHHGQLHRGKLRRGPGHMHWGKLLIWGGLRTPLPQDLQVPQVDRRLDPEPKPYNKR
jgi:hypothetical protein